MQLEEIRDWQTNTKHDIGPSQSHSTRHKKIGPTPPGCFCSCCHEECIKDSERGLASLGSHGQCHATLCTPRHTSSCSLCWRTSDACPSFKEAVVPGDIFDSHFARPFCARIFALQHLFHSSIHTQKKACPPQHPQRSLFVGSHSNQTQR